MSMIKYDVIFPSAARTADVNSAQFDLADGIGALFVLDITATAGTPTLDLKLQGYDPLANKYYDVQNASFAQQTTTGTVTLELYPGIAETTNRKVSGNMPNQYRWSATIAGTTPSFTFTLSAAILGIRS